MSAGAVFGVDRELLLSVARGMEAVIAAIRLRIRNGAETIDDFMVAPFLVDSFQLETCSADALAEEVPNPSDDNCSCSAAIILAGKSFSSCDRLEDRPQRWRLS